MKQHTGSERTKPSLKPRFPRVSFLLRKRKEEQRFAHQPNFHPKRN